LDDDLNRKRKRPRPGMRRAPTAVEVRTMVKQIVTSLGMLIVTASLASAGPKRHTPNQKAINRVQADIRRDEAELAAAQRAGNAAAVAREQADLQRDRARLQQLQAGVKPVKSKTTTEGKKHKNGKKHHKHGEREHDRDR
jgi:hypothetical protein